MSLTNPSLNSGEAFGDTYDSIEDLVGSIFEDVLYGNGNDNHISGAGGNDRLVGAGGSDTLNGDAGNDIFVFDGLGSDFIGDFVSGQDRIDVSQFAFTFAALDSDADGTLEDLEGNGVVNVIVFGGSTSLGNALGSPGDSVYLVGVSALQESDFILA